MAPLGRSPSSSGFLESASLPPSCALCLGGSIRGSRSEGAKEGTSGDDSVADREAAAAIFVELDEVERGKGGRGAHVEEWTCFVQPSPARHLSGLMPLK